MASTASDNTLRQIHRLFGEGTVAGLSDRQLLERFTAARDEAAFAALVARHGPLVLGTCRALLGDAHDAEDAFQTTFATLARKAPALWAGASLGGWLYRVARRAALRAKASSESKRRHERQAMVLAAAVRDRASPWSEWLPVLHEEIGRLPERHRAPIVLCCLQELTYEEAARELRWTVPTLRCRLAKARERLRGRLARRGIGTEGAGAVLASGLDARLATSAVAPAWAREAVRAATAGASVSSTATVMITLMLNALGWTRLRGAAMIALLLGAVVSIGTLTTNRGRPDPDRPSAPRSGDPPGATMARVTAPAAARGDASQDDDSDAKVEFRGRVVGPDGRPVAGAKLYLTPTIGYLKRPYPTSELATTAPDGRFRLAVPRTKFGDNETLVVAAAPNLGAGWLRVTRNDERDGLTLQLVDDDVPITGQIVDLEGKPVLGATLRVLQINAAPGEDLGPWLEAVEGAEGASLQLAQRYLSRYTIAPSTEVTTDVSGRFRLDGIGRNRLVTVQLDGPTIVSQQLHILTRPGKVIELQEPESRGPRTLTAYYGASFRHAAAPCKPIVGVVRDKDTNEPLAGVTIRSYMFATRPNYIVEIVRTTTDAEGRYRLTGMPKGVGNRIMAVPGGEQPYLVSAREVADSPGLDPVTADVELKRGVWIQGKLTDKVTREPVSGSVEYFALYTNPNLPTYPGFDGAIAFNYVSAKEDGSYRIIGIPGPGLVAVLHKQNYLRAPERDDEEGIRETSLRTAPYHLLLPINYGALARIDPATGVDSVRRDITLDPGWTFTGTVLGTTGEPLAGARGFGLTGKFPPWDREGMKTAEFTVRGYNPHQPRDLLLQHPGKGLVGVVPPPRENGGSVTVRMVPGATVRGRLVDADGRPRVRVELRVAFRPQGGSQWESYLPGNITTEGEGRFRIEALLPGYEFRISVDKRDLPLGDSLRSGQTKELGDVVME